jgi:hypothetical protein
VHPSYCGEECDKARIDYEFISNKLYFDANMLNRTNFQLFRELNIPKAAFPLIPPAPQCGIVDVARHDLRGRIDFGNTTAYIGYVRVIKTFLL